MDIRGDEDSNDEEEEISIEAPEADTAEQRQDVRPPSGWLRPDLPLEVDPGDAVEQELDVRQRGDSVRRELPLEVDPADAADQDRVVDVDDDEYR
ncbi:hypothetical protein [Nonomuraea sp. NPDC002799]